MLLAVLALAASPQYAAVQARLAQGWNTWDVHSVAAQVLLPEGFTIRVGLRHNTSLNSDAFLADPLIGRQGSGVETVFPGPHRWDGSYTEARISWRGHEFLLQSAHVGKDLVLLATPLSSSTPLPPTLVVSAGVLWNHAGAVSKDGGHIEFQRAGLSIPVYWTGREVTGQAVPVRSPFFAATFQEAIGVSTGKPRTVAEIRQILQQTRPKSNGVKQAIETVIGWDTIFDPSQKRVISPVSRVWSTSWGGYVLFDWDTFFAATLAGTGSRDLAYANAVEILREETPLHFVPNFARAGQWKSFDRSEPPVGAITVLNLYKQFHEEWFLRDTFAPLLEWNRWWAAHRDVDGYLVWGSDADNQPRNPDDKSVGTLQGAKYESGLDNSPMYDDAPFKNDRMLIADVGLMGMYVADCDALAEIAKTIGRPAEASELTTRAQHYRAQLQKLWDEKTGMYLNRNLATGEFSPRLSPTNFYPLLAKAPTPEQAKRMVNEHLLNPHEFWGEWVIPAISRSDAAFQQQDYWRGRIWGPMNYLVYLGLRNYDLPDVRRQLGAKSLALFEKEWKQNGHVHENYNAITGSGDDVTSSDRFYHWGALLGLIGYEEEEPAASGR